MKIAILGTGMVGRTLAEKLDSIGHTITMGTRDPAATLARTEGDNWGNPGFADWHKAHPGIAVLAYADVANNADLVINALSGGGTLDGLKAVGAPNLNGKILIDIANPLDFSQGFPPSLSIANTDSLGEQVQKAFPDTRVVKTLNTVNAYLMADPIKLADGDHTMCVCGNDADAKAEVTRFLKTELGWKDIIDLGGIESARGTEAVLLWWTRLFGILDNPMFAFKVVR